VTQPEPELKIIRLTPQDPRLGRAVVHDPRSRNYAAARRAVVRKDKAHRIYDPTPNPDQTIGNCTGVAECVMANTVGNRRLGVRLNMSTADKIYSRATQIDVFPGIWPPVDSGSSGLAAAKAAVEQGIGTGYEWYFGIDAVLDGLQTRPISIGTWWPEGMFERDINLRVRPTGQKLGGHQWTLRAHWPSSSRTIGQQLVEGICWWGSYRALRMTVDDFAELLADDGDAHHTMRRGWFD
jgi:hypothetical protein